MARLESRYFSFGDVNSSNHPSPWKAAFPYNRPQGYWEAFVRRCAKLSGKAQGLVDEETARKVWLEILRDYEEYVRMGMWLPDGILDEHRQVAVALGWFS